MSSGGQSDYEDTQADLRLRKAYIYDGKFSFVAVY